MLRSEDKGLLWLRFQRSLAVMLEGETTEKPQAKLIHVFKMISEEYQAVSQELSKNVEVAVT